MNARPYFFSSREDESSGKKEGANSGDEGRAPPATLPPHGRSGNRPQSERRARSARMSSEKGPPSSPRPSRRGSGSSQGIRAKRSSTAWEGPTGGSPVA